MNAQTLAVFRLYQLFNGILFSGPIWAVFLLSRGLSLTQFGIVEACLHVGMLLAQVPTGALADALGRRRLLVAAGFFSAAAELGYVYAPGFALICVAGAVHGVAFALRTGADEAYLFDSLAHDDAQAQFPRMLGGLWAVFQFAGAISFMVGGLIATYSPPLAFWLTAACALTASAIATRLPDDARGEAGHGVRVAARGLGALRRSPRLAALTLAWSVY
jgi:MFS family permease